MRKILFSLATLFFLAGTITAQQTIFSSYGEYMESIGEPIDAPAIDGSGMDGCLAFNTTPSGDGVASQIFEPALSAFDSEAATDFIIEPGCPQTLTDLLVTGTGGDGTPGDFIVTIYEDDGSGNAPSATIVCTETFPATAVDDGTGSLTISLTACVDLVPGKYWLSVVADRDFGTDGQWFWSTATTVEVGVEDAWQNPGNGFGTGCTGWTPVTTCGFTSPEFLFSLCSVDADCGPIPTMSEWGIIILALLFMIIGIVFMYAKNQQRVRLK